jgi:hypothetical protein
MLQFLCDYMTERLAIKIAKSHKGLEATITMERGFITESLSIDVYKGVRWDQEGKVFLEVLFDKKKMEHIEKVLFSPTVSSHWEQNVFYYLGFGYGKIPVYKLTRVDETGFLRFDVTDYSEDKARQLFDSMLYRFPSVIRK